MHKKLARGGNDVMNALGDSLDVGMLIQYIKQIRNKGPQQLLQ